MLNAMGNELHASILTGQSNMLRMRLEWYSEVVNGEIGTNHTLFVKRAIGRIPIKWWDEAIDGKVYRTLMNAFKKAVDGRDLTTIHVIWKQCGADVFHHRVDKYRRSFDNVYAQFQRDLGQDFFLIIGQLNRFLTTNEWRQMEGINREIVESYPRATLVPTSDVDDGLQPLHHTRLGYIEIGRRYGEVALNNILGGGQ